MGFLFSLFLIIWGVVEIAVSLMDWSAMVEGMERIPLLLYLVNSNAFLGAIGHVIIFAVGVLLIYTGIVLMKAWFS